MNSTEQYRRALSQGYTPSEAEEMVAEEQEYERIEREIEAREKPVKTDAEIDEALRRLLP